VAVSAVHASREAVARSTVQILDNLLCRRFTRDFTCLIGGAADPRTPDNCQPFFRSSTDTLKVVPVTIDLRKARSTNRQVWRYSQTHLAETLWSLTSFLKCISIELPRREPVVRAMPAHLDVAGRPCDRDGVSFSAGKAPAAFLVRF
jgi:hypothetical protein